MNQSLTRSHLEKYYEMNLSLEISVIEKFFKKEKRDRYIGFISSRKNRRKFIIELAHLKDLQWDFFKEVNSYSPELLSGKYLSQPCYVISEDASIDQTTVSLEKLPQLTNTGQAMIVVFGEADQIYYQGEPPFNRYISKIL